MFISHFQPAGHFMTNLYVTLPASIATIPQLYTIHCIYKTGTSGLTVQYRMESSSKYCIDSPSLSCRLTHLNSTGVPEGDARLAVTWNASTVITQGTYLSQPEKRNNGDHDFVCDTMLESSSTSVIQFIRSPITVRGMFV